MKIDREKILKDQELGIKMEELKKEMLHDNYKHEALMGMFKVATECLQRTSDVDFLIKFIETATNMLEEKGWKIKK